MDYIILRSGKDINPNFDVDWPPEDTLSKDELINTLKKWWHTTNKSDEKLKCIINAIFIDGYKIFIDWSDTYNIIQAHHMKTHQIIDLIFAESFLFYLVIPLQQVSYLTLVSLFIFFII